MASGSERPWLRSTMTHLLCMRDVEIVIRVIGDGWRLRRAGESFGRLAKAYS